MFVIDEPNIKYIDEQGKTQHIVGSHSGYGDGCYDLSKIVSDGNCIGFQIKFI
jgi:hypothetical protein